jgi:hypothetical protein
MRLTSINLSVRAAHLLSLSAVLLNEVDVHIPDNPHPSKNWFNLSFMPLRWGNNGFLETAHINAFASFRRVVLCDVLTINSRWSIKWS